MDSDEEEECAIAIDGMKEVRHWVRNMPRKPNSFKLPLSAENSFFPDFVAELSNGKILVVEYKGAHLLAGYKLKGQIGELWERRSGGKNFFVTVSKVSGKPGISEQIQSKIDEIFQADRGLKGLPGRKFQELTPARLVNRYYPYSLESRAFDKAFPPSAEVCHNRPTTGKHQTRGTP